MNTTTKGREAEALVAEFLKSNGHTIIAVNWRNRWCEIDIISTRNKIVHFIEVKYRSSDRQGTGFDYITSKKLKQVQFAAEFWLAENNWSGESQLLAAEVNADNDIELIEIF